MIPDCLHKLAHPSLPCPFPTHFVTFPTIKESHRMQSAVSQESLEIQGKEEGTLLWGPTHGHMLCLSVEGSWGSLPYSHWDKKGTSIGLENSARTSWEAYGKQMWVSALSIPADRDTSARLCLLPLVVSSLGTGPHFSNLLTVEPLS